MFYGYHVKTTDIVSEGHKGDWSIEESVRDEAILEWIIERKEMREIPPIQMK